VPRPGRVNPGVRELPRGQNNDHVTDLCDLCDHGHKHQAPLHERFAGKRCCRYLKEDHDMTTRIVTVRHRGEKMEMFQ
jgi:hypothetical protein